MSDYEKGYVPVPESLMRALRRIFAPYIHDADKMEEVCCSVISSVVDEMVGCQLLLPNRDMLKDLYENSPFGEQIREALGKKLHKGGKSATVVSIDTSDLELPSSIKIKTKSEHEEDPLVRLAKHMRRGNAENN